MKKIMSIALTLIMTVSMCFGCFGSVYAATPDKITVTKAFSDCSWSEISEYVGMAENGKIDLSAKWNIGDTKDVTLTTGETIKLQIADFYHDTFEDGTTASITLVMKDCLNAEAPMNSSNTNSGGYPASNMASYVESNIYDKLPEDLKAVVAPVKKKCYTSYNDANSLSEVSSNVWLLSEAEVYGYITEGFSVGTGEGSKYTIFNEENRVKNRNGQAISWWVRSSYSGSATDFVLIDAVSDTTSVFSPKINHTNASQANGVVVGLCIKDTSENTNIIDVTVPESISLTADEEGKFSRTYTFANSGNVSLNIKGTVNMANGWELVESTSEKAYKDSKKVSLCMNNVDIASIKHDTASDTDIGGVFDAGKSIDVTVSGRAALSSEALQNVNFASFNLTITPH